MARFLNIVPAIDELRPRGSLLLVAVVFVHAVDLRDETGLMTVSILRHKHVEVGDETDLLEEGALHHATHLEQQGSE